MSKPYFIAECVAFLCSFRLLFLKSDRYLKWFILYTLIVVATEIASLYILGHKWSNHVLLNLYLPFDMLFFYWVFAKSFKEKSVVKAIKILAVTGSIFYLVNIALGQGIHRFNTYTIIFEFISLSALAFTYLYFLAHDHEKKKYYRLTMFWVSVGILLYSLLESIIFSAFTFLSYKKLAESKLFGTAFEIVNNICNVICYLLFSIGFLCQLKRQN